MKTNLSIKFILISFTLTFLNSCVITNTPGFYNGYKKLTPEEKSSVVMLSSDSKLERIFITSIDELLPYNFNLNKL